MGALLEVRQVTKIFPGVRALDAVDLTLRAGEIHALIGENGAGKSSLVKIITGVYGPDGGEVRLRGEVVRFSSPRASLAAGIAVVHQERNLIPRYSIAENMFLDRLPTQHGLVQHAKMREDARRWLDMLEVSFDPATPVRRLSVAHMQLVEIGRALSLNSKLLLLDEPTASISESDVDRLFKVLRRLRDQGAAILFVSHKIEEVMALCNRVTVLRDGKNACNDRPLEGMKKVDIITLMVGRENAVSGLGARNQKLGERRLELRSVATELGHRSIDLYVRAGEVVGLYGLVGAGRSELAKAIIGVHKLTGGELLIDGKHASIGGTFEALRKWRIGYVSEDRKSEGLILTHSVARNTAITIWHAIASRLGLISGRREDSAIRPYVERLNIKATSLAQTVGNLSGGNQQKVSVAKWLAANTGILIIDEPTVGVDVRTKGYLHQLVWELADSGVAVLLITSDLSEMIQLADRIYVMNDYRVIEELNNSREYDRMSPLMMNTIQIDNDRVSAPKPAAAVA